MRPLYSDLKDLEKKSQEYFKTYKQRAPRHYRVYLGITKDLLAKWRTMQPEYFNYIKQMEEIILADIEKAVVYGQAKNVVGKIFILKAYDRETYGDQPKALELQEQRAQPLAFVLDTTEERLEVVENGTKNDSTNKS